MKATRKISKREQSKNAGRSRTAILSAVSTLGILGVVSCCYAHAAVNTDLQISGEAKIKATGDFGINYMQDMKPEICQRVPVDTTKQMIDKRDGKKYWVAKLADGECWMTQNLALDLTTAGLTSELTDLQPNDVANYETTTNAAGETVYLWNANSKYPPMNTTVGAFTSSSTTGNNVAAKSSRTDELYLMAEPMKNASVSAEKVASLADVKGVRLIDVRGWKPTYKYDKETGLAYDEPSKTYDPHYLLGNYYATGAATAGSARSVAHTRAESSICPKGWTLPQQTSNVALTTEKGYYALLQAYGVDKNIAYAGGNVIEPPLYLFRPGFITSGTKYQYVGERGTYWTMYGNSQNYRLALTITTTATIAQQSSYAGRTVRCVAR